MYLFRMLSLFVFVLCCFEASPTQIGAFKILPKPKIMEEGQGKGINYDELEFIFIENELNMPVLGDIANGLPRYLQKGKGIYLKQEISNEIPGSEEGYVLYVTDKGIEIKARGKVGLFYGCQTLEQLLEDSRDFNVRIPPLKIIDFPDVAYRAVHIDSKHHLDNMDYYYRYIDKLAKYKINAVIWEIEDKLRYTRRPEIGTTNAISKQEMATLCRYAQERNVEISPLVQGLGHASFILKHHWEVREDPANDWAFCPSDPKTYEIQFDLYADVLEAMPTGRYLHVGGDEVKEIGFDERCKATGKSSFELQMEWLRKVCKFATDHGRIPIFWDDMPLKYAGMWELILSDKTEEELNKIWNTDKLDAAIDLFPKDCIYMRWNYGDATKPAHQRIMKWYHDKGLKVMGATAAAAGNSPYMPREVNKISLIRDFNLLVEKYNLEGILTTSWADGSPHPETVWRNIISQGEYGWNTAGRNIQEFKEAYAQREFGFLPDDNRLSFIEEMQKEADFFDGALITSGKRNPGYATRAYSLMELPDRNKPGKWSEMYKDKVTKAQVESVRIDKVKQDISIARKYALRNRYSLEIYEQLNFLFDFPVQLLLSLHAYDEEKDWVKKQDALKKIQKVCDYFTDMRIKFEKVYSKSRFLTKPEGYIMDIGYRSHLASKTNNSDWIFYYELPMKEKITEWIKEQKNSRKDLITIEKSIIYETVRDTLFLQARSAWIPVNNSVIIPMSIHGYGSHAYSDIYTIETDDLGKTWSSPCMVKELRREEVCEKYMRVFGDVTPQWHERSGTVLCTGKSFFSHLSDSLLLNKDKKVDIGYMQEVAYAVYKPQSKQWSGLKAVVLPDKLENGDAFVRVNTGCSQRFDLPDGNILLPVCYSKNNMGVVMVLLCSFDGDSLKYIKHGNGFTVPGKRGLGEASIACYGGNYFLTMREDRRGYVTKSKDGLNYEEMKEWRFSDGEPLGSYNTQQHWIANHHGLFLIYTRKGANNDAVFRHRSPLFIAKVDPDKLCVIRETEQVLLPIPYGEGDMGNFGIIQISDNESWLTVAVSPKNFGSAERQTRIFLAKIHF